MGQEGHGRKTSMHALNFLKIIIYLFLAVWGLCCCTGFSLVAASGGDSRVAMCGLLTVVASLVAKHRL